ncbi:MAG: hypothetical protein M0D54_12690 [Hyphomonadaceae bacterium JAD_PAG50586_4]|nr:MAG: hypothetical protein M0D54_12690 [Hyphomonadaceae bacterium JAD_PAG50586_4]
MGLRLFAMAVFASALLNAPTMGLTPLPWPEEAPDCSGLSDALREGSTIVCRERPTVEGLALFGVAFPEVEHRFRCNEPNVCTYTYSRSDMTLWCRLSEAGREAFASIRETNHSGPLPELVRRECEARDRTGAVVPIEPAPSSGDAG